MRHAHIHALLALLLPACGPAWQVTATPPEGLTPDQQGAHQAQCQTQTARAHPATYPGAGTLDDMERDLNQASRVLWPLTLIPGDAMARVDTRASREESRRRFDARKREAGKGL
jgi:hypothetical protein